MSETSLLIIDVQLGNFEEPHSIHKGDELLAKVKGMITRARSAQIPVIYIQNDGGRGDPDEYGTPGWEIHPSIAPVEGDMVVRKQSPDAFHGTNLQGELESRCIKKLVVAGLQTEYCIDATCRRAYSLGYDIILIRDAHSTWNSTLLTAQQIIEHHNQVLGGWFVTLKKEEEIEF